MSQSQTNFIGTIITDCSDPLARSRQQLRFHSLFGVQPTFLGVGRQAPDLEAAGTLVDQLDALTNPPTSRQPAPAVILVNVAPRGGRTKQIGDNGTPFCYTRIGQTLIVSTYAGRALDLVARLGLVSEVQLLDIPTVTAAAVEWGELTPEQANRINNTQFRSLEFLPLVAYWLSTGRPVPSTTRQLEPANVTGLVWHIDNFGNAKTTLLPSDVSFDDGKTIALPDGHTATMYRRLTDVPADASALVIGSSGFGPDRFLEVVVQWRDHGHTASDSAASRHQLSVGSTLK